MSESPTSSGKSYVHAPLAAARELGFRQCVAQLRKTLCTTPLGWGFVGWLTWHAIPHQRMLLWLGCALAAWALGLALLVPPAGRSMTILRDGWRLYLAAALDGLAWGAMLPILAPPQTNMFLWLLVTLYGVMSVTAMTYIGHLRAYLVSSGCLVTVLLINGAMRYQSPDQIRAMVSSVLLLGFILFYLHAVARRVLEGYRLQIENAWLTERLREALAVARQDAATDPLTGLVNRRGLNDALASWQNKVFNRGRTLSLLMIDLDHFKKVNDEHGHDVGDRVLQAFADRVRGLLRAQDLFARQGGEEFVILLPDTDAETAMQVGSRIHSSIQGFPLLACPPISVTASIGIAQHQGEESIDDLLTRADAAAYLAKRLGRNQIQIAS